MKRPYRLWNTRTKAWLKWRYYKVLDNAKIGALIEAKYSDIGTTIELIDQRGHKLVGQYTRRPNNVTFAEAQSERRQQRG
jgi:hypothetical protein